MAGWVLLLPGALLAQSESSCPLPIGRQIDALRAFAEMMPVFRHPRCSNCHGGVDPHSEAHPGADQIEPVGNDFQAYIAQCQDCHDGLPGWHVPGEPLFFVGKSDEQICLQMKQFEPTGPSFVEHIFNDHEGVQFIAAAFVGDRALGEGLRDYDLVAEKPPGTQAELTAKARKWTELLGDAYQRSKECGCVVELEGTFTQTDEANFGPIANSQTITGRIVWTAESEGQSAPTFGDTSSKVFRPSGGEITVETRGVNQTIGGGPGSCTLEGRKTFDIEALPQSALQFLRLEIADDARYKLTLGMRDGHLLLDVTSVCSVPGGRVVRETIRSNEAAIQLGVLEGTLSDEGVVGRLPAPLRRGPRVIDGQWSFGVAAAQ